MQNQIERNFLSLCRYVITKAHKYQFGIVKIGNHL